MQSKINSLQPILKTKNLLINNKKKGISIPFFIKIEKVFYVKIHTTKSK